ncbi:hypothetical protein [Hymenobacter terrenus]|uniref:hypothetical protein n=1 Tax=Hymenobacter terrenus TaxID=1629124 RepID=UPI0012DFFE10|nr:hypothetical protein [Hymenobacter terrenus]
MSSEPRSQRRLIFAGASPVMLVGFGQVPRQGGRVADGLFVVVRSLRHGRQVKVFPGLVVL